MAIVQWMSRVIELHGVRGDCDIMVIGNYLYKQCISPLKLWGVLDTTLCDKVCQWLAAGRFIFPGTPVSSTNKPDGHDIAEILLKVALNNVTLSLTLA